MYRIVDDFVYYKDDSLEMETEIQYGPVNYTTDVDVNEIMYQTITYVFKLGSSPIYTEEVIITEEIVDEETGVISYTDNTIYIDWYDGEYKTSTILNKYKYNTTEEITEYKREAFKYLEENYYKVINETYITSKVHDSNGLTYMATDSKLDDIQRSIIYGEHYAAVHGVDISTVNYPFNADNIITLSNGSIITSEAAIDRTYTKIELQKIYLEIFDKMEDIRSKFIIIADNIAKSQTLEYIFELKYFDVKSDEPIPDEGDFASA